MQHIIFTSKFNCELCKREIPIPLFGDSNSSFTPADEPELVEWGEHYHWIDFHRARAVCGEIVKSGDLEVAVNDGAIEIHKEYTDHYKRIEQGARFGHLLIVHKNCVTKYE